MTGMKKLIVGNWKMNGSIDDARHLIADIINRVYTNSDVTDKAEFVVCPPFLHIPAVRHALYTTDTIAFGAQDCSQHGGGAYTGDMSAEMVKDSQCVCVILGHSERRQYHNETDNIVMMKATRAHEAGLIAIICVGEQESDRDAGAEEGVVAAQLAASIPSSATVENLVVAYEPVWAIGTGKTATPDDVRSMHAFIRKKLQEQIEGGEKVRILYGGSMKPDNAKALLATENVDGGLIGGASLKAEQFLAIAKAA